MAATATTRRAGYHSTRDTYSTHTPGGSLQQYVQTDHGVLCRTALGEYWEIVILPLRGAALYIGHVERRAGAWVAIDGNGNTVATVAGPNGDYLTAEAALLLASPTAEPAYGHYVWPAQMVRRHQV